MKNKKWDRMYLLAEKYYKEYGNLIIDDSSDFDNKQELREWLITQRRNFKLKKLVQEKIDLLNGIGMIWSAYDMKWTFFYEVAEEYFNANGNLNVPIRFITGDDIQLGSWISHQRRAYKSKKLSEERIILLEKIGMVWDPAKDTWDEMYKIAKQYFKENNNLNIPNEFFYKNVSLGSWIKTQRQNYKQKFLKEDQINKLNEIGMEWDPIRNQNFIWDKNYNTVLEFYNKYKHLYIPTNYISKDGINIGRWLYDQKLKYNKNKLIEYRKNKLDALDKTWLEPSNTKSSFPEFAVLYYIKKHFNSAQKYKTKEISEIDIFIPELNIGIEYDGPSHVNSAEKDKNKSFICKEHGINLIRIRDSQLPLIEDPSYKILLSNDSLDALNDGIIKLFKYLDITQDINISRDYFEISDNYINSIDLDWYNMYDRLKEYHNIYGNIDVPIYYKTADGILLGHWLSNIRNSVKNPNLKGTRLNTHKIELLEELGIDWSPIETQWNRIYNIASKYYNDHGDLLVPNNYITEDNIRLGRWIGTQRDNYKKHILSDEKINLLEKIGMVWSLK